MNREIYYDNEEFSLWNINSIILYIKDHIISFFLLLLVLVIIYIVDHISNINTIIFSFPSPVTSLPVHNNMSQIQTRIKIPKKRLSTKK
jgi:hypothetical protein